MARRTLDGRNPRAWVPSQRITAAEAVRAYTVRSAFAERQDGAKGSLGAGSLADLAGHCFLAIRRCMLA